MSTRDFIGKIRKLSKSERKVTEKSDIACVNRHVSLNIPFTIFESANRSISKLLEVLDNINGITLILKVPKGS